MKYPWSYKFKKGKICYLSVPCTFDTETTSIELPNGVKTGFVWVWQMCINGHYIYGRTISEWIEVLLRLKHFFWLGHRNDEEVDHRMCIYIHNMGFDIQFVRKQLSRFLGKCDSFIMDARKGLYFSFDGFEFRCSYLLTGSSLETVGKNLTTYKCEKAIGDLNYDLIRNRKTPIIGEPKGGCNGINVNNLQDELKYCIYDVRVQACKIQELLDETIPHTDAYNGEYGRLSSIPYTFTGYVREDMRKAVLEDKKAKQLVQSLKLTRLEYKMWKQAFQGGFTHGNIRYVNQTCKGDDETGDIVSYDFTSSYPTVMISEFYPMGTGEIVSWLGSWKDYYDENFKIFAQLMSSHILLFDITYYDIELRDKAPDAIISKSKCRDFAKNKIIVNGKERTVDDIVVDNGKIRKGKKLSMTITSEDFLILQKYYKCSGFEIGLCYKYIKGRLPKPIIEKILYYYQLKTTLKDVKGKEREYQLGKARINATFGLMVMDIIREVFEYCNDIWLDPKSLTLEQEEEVIQKYNDAKDRFNWYPWGVMITAYARRNLLLGIWEVGKYDFIYSDTDSMKIFNASEHLDYIFQYNKDVTEKLENCLDYYGLDKTLIRPKTIKGVEKPLGIWDFDGQYKQFKFLHSKCYIGTKKQKDGSYELECTVAGISKENIKKALEEDAEEYGTSPFVLFSDNYEVDAERSGKLCHTYCDDEYTFEVTDYLGNTETVTSECGVHLGKIPFKLNMTEEYLLLMESLGLGGIE